MIAHKRVSDGREQSISAHSIETARLCAMSMKPLGMEKLGYITGLTHDMGKLSARWQSYLLAHFTNDSHAPARGELHHAPVGAIFIFERWFSGSFAQRAAAQTISMAVYAHHSALSDALSVDKSSPLLEKLAQDKDALCYDEAVANFLSEVCSLERLDMLFREAAAEIGSRLKGLNAFSAGLLLRWLLGALVDADRWGSACFEYAEDPFAAEPPPAWSSASAALAEKLAGFPVKSRLAEIRSDISEACLAAAEAPPGIFRLTVPTGGGKTFASLRFALRHAERNRLKRIFYIIPYNTILDQNALDIREALGESVSILEHHSNVVFEENAQDNELEDYKKLTERWRSEIILTSMVQFLNAFYSAKNTDARRLSGLSGAVIIFDEIQALPKSCTRLFEKAVGFLHKLCGCTVVLCTATQPQLALETAELVPDTPRLFESLRRTTLIDDTAAARSTQEASADIVRLVEKHGSALMIVNTRKMARSLYAQVSAAGIPCIHLSTDMYPEHRLRLIDQIKNRPEDKPLFCISTALIEAGVNISFPCVIRSLAGLGSILQAAGRCNRNAELPEGLRGEVHIWLLADESLRGLPEIADAQQCTRGLLAARGAQSAASPEGIEAYYALERQKFAPLLPYPADIGGMKVTLLDILGENTISSGGTETRLPLRGAYRSAGERFRVIPDDTISVLVCRGRGGDIAAELAGGPPMRKRQRLLREAQRYSVSLYREAFRRLAGEGAIHELGSSGVYALQKEYYSEETGLSTQAQPMDDLQF